MSLRAVGFGVCAALVLATQSWAATAPDDTAQSAANIKAHITFLASDLLLGRETGSPGHEIAANYAASQLAQLGLKPGGDGGSYFQHVPLVAFRPANQGSYVLHDKSGKATTLVFGEDYLVSRNPLASETRLSAQMVFVGYGIEDRDKRRNDYAGLNLKGKIAVVIGGAPASYQTEERAYYANGRTKRATAAAHGAIGLLTLSLPEDEKRYPFANAVRQWQSWGMSWRKADGTAFVVAPSVTSLGTISANGAAKLLDGLPVSLTQIADMADSKAANPPRFEIPGRLEVSFATEIKPLDSMNVVGVIPGTDPVLKDQVVVLSAHLDHLGVTAPVNGDSINNGAMDNAAGSATTLEVARKFMASGLPPKRTTLFLLTTGEEKGLIGAEYFARNPTVPLEQIVADVDLDMPILTYDFTDVIAFGSDRSGIGPAVQRAAGRMNIKLSPDPLPEEGLFTRSDHYRFVEVGVPAVFFMTGFANGGEHEFRTFLAERYHKPSDDMNQAFNFTAGARFAELNYQVTRELTDAPTAPTWNKGDFFGRKFGRAAK